MGKRHTTNITAPKEQTDPLLFGADATTAIVAVEASASGHARVWRRKPDGTVSPEHDSFTPWLLTSDPTPFSEIPIIDVADDPGFPRLPEERDLAVFKLRGEGYFRYMALARDFRTIESLVLRHERRERLWDLRDKVYYRPPIEQYLISSGRTYYKGLLWNDIRRLQLDLETTSLSPQDGRIFMASLRDNTGWETVIDAREYGGEAGLIGKIVEIVRERDPDVIEGHNIFAFDLPFLIVRSKALGSDLTLSRDDSAPRETRDVLKVGARTERFTRYHFAGREIIDTLHAVKRHDAIVHDIRSYGLKEVATYFGLASGDRQYVEGSRVYDTWREDPEQVRRYALDDVREVEAISSLLMASSFALASMVPKSYERVATAGTGQGLIEPLLVRAYLSAGHSLPRGSAQTDPVTYVGGYTRMYRSGILSNVVKADVASLYPSIMLAQGIAPRSDVLGSLPRMLRELTTLRLEHKQLGRLAPPESREHTYHAAMQGAMKILINSFYGSMGASYALFGDIGAAAKVTASGQQILKAMMQALANRGMDLVEADTDGVYFTVPDNWSEDDELALIEDISSELPEGITVEHDGRYRRMYSYQEKNYILQGYDGRIKLVGAAFRNSRNEPYGERFFNEALPHLMDADFDQVRACFERYVSALRNRELPVEDVAVTVQLTKTEEEYRRSGRSEEQYKVLQSAGQHWEPGDRVKYYHALARSGKLLKLYQPGATDYDPEYYINKLRHTFAARLAKAVAPDHLNTLFGEMRGLFDPAPSEVAPVVVVENELE